MINIIPFGTKSGVLRMVIRRSNYPQVEVSLGSAAYWALPPDVRAVCITKGAEYLTKLGESYDNTRRGLLRVLPERLPGGGRDLDRTQ